MATIHDAAAKGDCAAILKELQHNPNNIDTLDNNRSQGLTPLQYAVSQNQIKAVRLLIEKGADVNKRSKNDLTALIIVAAQTANFDEVSRAVMFEVLVNGGAQFDSANPKDARAINIFRQNSPDVYNRFATFIASSFENNAQSQSDQLVHRIKQTQNFQ